MNYYLFIIVIILFNLNYISSTSSPTSFPTLQPTLFPTRSPTTLPTLLPTTLPTLHPTFSPTSNVIISWNSSYTTFYTDGEGSNDIRILISSNREIYRNNGGHFRVQINASSPLYGGLNSTSECIEVGIGVPQLMKLLKNTPIKFTSRNYTELLGNYINVVVKKVGDGKIGSKFQTNYYLTFTSSIVNNIIITISRSDCVPIQTIGLWSDQRNWETNIIPKSTDSVFIPQDAGFIQLDEDIQISALNMHGGVIIAHNSPCPYGWSLSSPDSILGKCYKLVDDVKTYLKADEVCRGQGKSFGTLGTSLVQIEDYTELNTVRGLCRGNSGSITSTTGCWIGLQDANGTGYFNWRDPASMINLSFRNWRRRSDRSDRLKLESPSAFVNNGDNCVHLVPWQNDPVYQEEGSLREVSCIDEPKSFICQMSVVPKRYTITLTQYSTFQDGSLFGGNLILLNSFNFTHFIVNSTATITTSNSNNIGFIRQLILLDGSTFILGTNVNINSESYIGEYPNKIGRAHV